MTLKAMPILDAQPGQNFPYGAPASPDLCVVGTAGNPTVITLPALDGQPYTLAGLVWSYSAAPSAGGLTVEDGSGNVVFSIDIIASGKDNVDFEPPLTGTPGTALIITLAGGGGVVIGKLNANAWFLK